MICGNFLKKLLVGGLALPGLSKAKAATHHNPPGKWKDDYWHASGLVVKQCRENSNLLLRNPNQEDDWLSFREKLITQWELTGMAFVWKVPNACGGIHEVHVLPTYNMILQPSSVEYPDGHYRLIMVKGERGIPIIPECVDKFTFRDGKLYKGGKCLTDAAS